MAGVTSVGTQNPANRFRARACSPNPIERLAKFSFDQGTEPNDEQRSTNCLTSFSTVRLSRENLNDFPSFFFILIDFFYLYPVKLSKGTNTMSDSTTNQYIWEHRFRPKTLKDVILPQDYRNFFNKIVADNAGVNILLESRKGGTGKTTVAQALANDLGAQFMKLNASNSNGINTIRNTVEEFAKTMSFNDTPKLVLLDEADGLTPEAQKALREILDDLSDNCRFILTCNYANKIIPAIRDDEGGRTMTLKFDMQKPEYRAELIPQVQKRIFGILKYLQIPFEEEAVKSLIEKKFPSIRTILARLQCYSMMKGKIDSGLMDYVNIGDVLCQMILEKKLTDSMNYINEHCLNYTDVFGFLKTEVIPKMKKKGDAYLQLSEYDARASISNDPEIHILACLIQMFQCV